MRKYQKNGILESVVCNGCGKKLVVERGILREGGLPYIIRGIIFPKKTAKSTTGICVRTAMTV